ncbi:DsrE family protein [Candidatus Igneacidithiobacillus taiwanensis]|uniref:DsrE family protein n=1 Tax=Candidatus Igneacidithiobacillus taiwanensis TaxID=1945924 RepID=UPI0028A06277|nr:DsrE family protein [Candidatus Igneacidithiobacillus taiwanensis]MCE5361034.1 DsrE family protein [Acidithiobacillus sp.]
MAEDKNHSRRQFLGGMVLAGAASAVAVTAQGQGMGMGMMGPSKNKVVYQLNQSDPGYVSDILHSAAVVLGHFNNDVDIAIDCFGPGIWLLVKASKQHEHYSQFIREQVSSLHMYNVRFLACEQTMKTIKIGKEDLISEATPVFSGAVELITLQQQGYAYIAW